MAETRIIDISTPLDERTPVYAGDPAFTRTIVASIDDEGGGYNLSTLAMSAHSGTHIDAPAHFLAKGKTIDQIQPRRWLSTAVVIDVDGIRRIRTEDLERHGIRTGDSVLLRANAKRPADAHPDDFSSLSLDAAAYLVSKKINLVGIDALSIEAYDDPSWPVHKKLLRNNILILEGLRLQHVAPGRYTLIATPLLITGGDGAPARALLVTRT
ncbi:MAG: cyclase family protein [Bacteroidetes bacterium]|nr:cyclase family protein [Bacteroidota bacterium]